MIPNKWKKKNLIKVVKTFQQAVTVTLWSMPLAIFIFSFPTPLPLDPLTQQDYLAAFFMVMEAQKRYKMSDCK